MASRRKRGAVALAKKVKSASSCPLLLLVLTVQGCLSLFSTLAQRLVNYLMKM